MTWLHTRSKVPPCCLCPLVESKRGWAILTSEWHLHTTFTYPTLFQSNCTWRVPVPGGPKSAILGQMSVCQPVSTRCITCKVFLYSRRRCESIKKCNPPSTPIITRWMYWGGWIFLEIHSGGSYKGKPYTRYAVLKTVDRRTFVPKSLILDHLKRDRAMHRRGPILGGSKSRVLWQMSVCRPVFNTVYRV